MFCCTDLLLKESKYFSNLAMSLSAGLAGIGDVLFSCCTGAGVLGL